jgi:hypothetical protein
LNMVWINLMYFWKMWTKCGLDFIYLFIKKKGNYGFTIYFLQSKKKSSSNLCLITWRKNSWYQNGKTNSYWSCKLGRSWTDDQQRKV